MRRVLRLLAVLSAAALILGACDDGDDGDDLGTGPREAATTAPTEAPDGDDTGVGAETADGDAVLTVVEDPEFGPVLRDGEGMALYAFTQDSENASACTGECAELWPPLTVEGGQVPVGEGVDESEVGTIARDDGTTQVTIAGRPLYFFATDEQPGETNGQGVGGQWFQVAPDGSLVGR